VLAAGPVLAKLETWRQEGSSAFAKHHRQGVVISNEGRVRLGHALLPTGSMAAERVWDVVRGKDGTRFAATGDAGKVFRQEPKDGAAWAVALDAADTQALSLAATGDGKVFVGTGPSGQVIEVTDPAHPSSRPDGRVQYIWDLAADKDGNLYAATGPNGQLWKRSREGKWSLLLDSKATHLLSVAVDGEGVVYAGSDGEGLIYRVTREGKTSILYDAPQAEVRSLLVAPDGSLYAGTAAEATGGGSNRPALTLSDGPGDPPFPEPDGPATDRTEGGTTREAMRPVGLAQIPGRPGAQPPRPPLGGSASPRPVSPGDNAVYRVDRDGAAREVFRARALIFALCWSGDRLLAGTGPDGELYEIRDRANESTPLAKLDSGQILSLLAEPDGGVILGTGDPGSVIRLSPGYVNQGELVSDVHDTKLPSRFGALSWRAEVPAGTSLVVQVRTGNVGEPDETWSDWSAEQSDAATARAESPPGRFVQYKVKMSTRNPEQTPELTSIALAYRSSNLPPEISKLDVPDVGRADGAARQTRLNLRWDVSDPNDDDLQYTVEIRKDGWPDWLSLTREPITDKNYAWDTTAFPSGFYRVRVVASDRPSNSPEDALNRDRESLSVIVDHEAPAVTLTPREKKAAVVLSDALTRLARAEYAVDGGPWTAIFPDDGLFDTPREQINLALPDLKPGVHLLMVRGTDAAGNVGSADALIVVRN
jgi:hypothetical protein